MEKNWTVFPAPGNGEMEAPDGTWPLGCSDWSLLVTPLCSYNTSLPVSAKGTKGAGLWGRPVAQTIERSLCTHRVLGSIPGTT